MEIQLIVLPKNDNYVNKNDAALATTTVKSLAFTISLINVHQYL